MATKPEAKQPNYASIIQEILASVVGPIPINSLAEQMLQALFLHSRSFVLKNPWFPVGSG